MSLEEAIRENTAAVKEQTALLKTKLGGGGGGTTAAATTAAATTKPAGAKPTGKKVTIDTIKERFGAFLGVEDKKVRNKRIEAVSAMMQHFGVPRATALEEENWAEALGYLTKLEAGESINYTDDGDGDDGDDDAALI